MPRLLGALLSLVVGATAVRATDIPVTGLKLIVVDKTVASGSAKAVFVAKDPSVMKGAGTEPTLIAAELGVAFDATSGVFNMSSGPGWIVNKSTIAKYVNAPAPSGGAVKVSVIKPPLYQVRRVRSEGDRWRHGRQARIQGRQHR